MAKKKTQTQTIGRNVDVTVNGDQLTIVIDLSADPEPSASGKTNIIATSQGNQRVTDDVFLGLNVYEYVAKKNKKKNKK